MIVLQGRRNGGDLITFSPDGQMLVARYESGLQIWRALSSRQKPELIRDITIGWFQFAPDGRLFLDGPTSAILDLETMELAPIPSTGTGYRYLALAPGGKHVITTNTPKRLEERTSRINCWPADRIGAGPARWTVTLDGEDCFRAMFLSAQRFAVLQATTPRPGHPPYRHVIRSTADGRAVAESQTFEAGSDWLTVSPDGRWIAGARERHMVIWDVRDLGQPAMEWDHDNRRNYTDLAFHPSGRFLAATSNDQTVKLYNTRTWELAKTYTWDIGRMRSIAFSPDGTLAAAGSDTGKVVVWDVDL